MKIRVRDHVKVTADKMAKIGLSSTARTQLDLYCVAPGQSQAVHRHEGEDKIYYVVEGTGRFSVGGAEERLTAGEAVVAPAGVDHGLTNDSPELLLVLVMVAPPPAHMKRSGSEPAR